MLQYVLKYKIMWDVLRCILGYGRVCTTVNQDAKAETVKTLEWCIGGGIQQSSLVE